MEKIKQALAKVKKQTKQKVSNKEPIAPTRSLAKEPSKDIGEIKYTTTRVSPLDYTHLENNRIVSHLAHNANAGVFNSLRTQILQLMEQNHWQSIAIVSPTPDSGKSLVSVNLSISIAHQPQKTALLVDFDLRRPTIAKYMGINGGPSINEYISGDATVEQVLVNPGIQRLVIMPTGKAIERSAETLSTEKIKNLISELKDRYSSRIVIYDLPPLLLSDDAMVIMPQVDCVLMVVANGVSTPEEINSALAMVPKEKLIGVVYNKDDDEAPAYYY